MGTYQKEKNILEIYKQRKYNELLNERNEKIEAIKNKDEIQNFKKKAIKEFVKIYNANKAESAYELKEDTTYIGLEYELTQKSIDAINDIEKVFNDKIDERDRLMQEVKAQVEICENREQESAIYKMHGILNDDGKIFDYKK